MTASSARVRDFWSRPTAGGVSLASVEELMRGIGDHIRFDFTATDASTSADEVLRLGRGVCHDASHVAIAALRANGIPARFIWGYRLPEVGDQARAGRSAGLRTSAVSHAWVSVDLGSKGWRDFDPSLGQWVDARYVAVAQGRDLADAPTLEGEFSGRARQRLDVEIDIEALPTVPPGDRAREYA